MKQFRYWLGLRHQHKILVVLGLRAAWNRHLLITQDNAELKGHYQSDANWSHFHQSLFAPRGVITPMWGPSRRRTESPGCEEPSPANPPPWAAVAVSWEECRKSIIVSSKVILKCKYRCQQILVSTRLSIFLPHIIHFSWRMRRGPRFICWQLPSEVRLSSDPNSSRFEAARAKIMRAELFLKCKTWNCRNGLRFLEGREFRALLFLSFFLKK